MDGYLTSEEAAARLGVSHRRVLQIVHERDWPTQRIGTAFVLRAADVDALAAQGERKPGRPKKSAPAPEGETDGR